MSENKPQLVEVIAALRADIAEAMNAAPEDGIELQLNDVEVELKVQVADTRANKIGGKLGFKVLGFSAEAGAEELGSVSEQYAHTVKFKMTASKDGQSLNLAD